MFCFIEVDSFCFFLKKRKAALAAATTTSRHDEFCPYTGSTSTGRERCREVCLKRERTSSIFYLVSTLRSKRKGKGGGEIGCLQETKRETGGAWVSFEANR